MPSFQGSEGQLALLRIIRLRQAVLNQEIDTTQLQRIAELSTADLDVAIQRPFPELNQLKDLLLENAFFLSDEVLNDYFSWFDQQDYLNLRSLAVESNQQTLENALPVFAQFYFYFGQYIHFKKNDPEGVVASIDQAALLHACNVLKKQPLFHQRSEQALAPKTSTPSPASRYAWLEDHHIQAGIERFGLNHFGAHIVSPFTAENLGFIIDAERKKHHQTASQERYAIPLIINNNQRLDTCGTHWTCLLIIVTPHPTDEPPTITAHYTDSMQVCNPRAITTIIQEAIRYNPHHGLEHQTDPHPEGIPPICQDPQITIVGTQEQSDGYSCGYRAVQRLLKDLQQQGLLPKPNPETQHFIRCKTSNELYDHYYQYAPTAASTHKRSFTPHTDFSALPTQAEEKQIDSLLEIYVKVPKPGHLHANVTEQFDHNVIQQLLTQQHKIERLFPDNAPYHTLTLQLSFNDVESVLQILTDHLESSKMISSQQLGFQQDACERAEEVCTASMTERPLAPAKAGEECNATENSRLWRIAPFEHLIIDSDSYIIDASYDIIATTLLRLQQHQDLHCIQSLVIKCNAYLSNDNIKKLQALINEHSITTFIQFKVAKQPKPPLLVALENQQLITKRQKHARTHNEPQAEWSGDALQFVTSQTAKKLHHAIFHNTFSHNKASYADCLTHFFYLTDLQFNITIKQRRQIFNAMLNDLSTTARQSAEQLNTIHRLLATQFKENLSAKDIASLSQTLYERGLDGLTEQLYSQQLSSQQGAAERAEAVYTASMTEKPLAPAKAGGECNASENSSAQKRSTTPLNQDPDAKIPHGKTADQFAHCWPQQQLQINAWLNQYRHQWWKRGWVSQDRKTIATTLFHQLNQPHLDANKVLNNIADAKRAILTNDHQHHRHVRDGIHGRLYLFLTDLETRVQAASAPAQLDQNIFNEFAEIESVLNAFQHHAKLPKALNKTITELLARSKGNRATLDEKSEFNLEEITRRYQSISNDFARIIANSTLKEIQSCEDYALLSRYCQQKQQQFVQYFEQSEQLKAINQQRSVQVFRAMSLAATTLVNDWSVQGAKKAPLNQQVPIKIDAFEASALKCLPSAFLHTSYGFFNKKTTLNTVKVQRLCTQLLSQLEQTIHKTCEKPLQLEFKELTVKALAPSTQANNSPAWALAFEVHLTVDSTAMSVTYVLNAQIGQLIQIKPEISGQHPQPPVDNQNITAEISSQQLGF